MKFFIAFLDFISEKSFSLEEMDMLPLILVGRVVGMHRDISGKSSE